MEDDLELLQFALREYELQKKRVQYNTFFDIGEYFRHHNQYIKAVENYSIALNFSKKNHDLNLETMSRLGLVLCNISQQLNAHIIIDSLRDILKDCTGSNLYTNSIFVEIILDIVQNNKLNKETENKLKSIGINWGDDEFYFEYSDINNIHLILM
ncbi:hypothetical protein [Hespellia stercorisuis]|uniref:hypothetical protein n=1 Tax=Hespellia stercorisuis TaxID=180311 RepID=UPI0011605C33|nr:hypothetical protein [Hespellia stercorisuis]